MIRLALYARYSSENQRDAAIEDQMRQCRERAARRRIAARVMPGLLRQQPHQAISRQYRMPENAWCYG